MRFSQLRQVICKSPGPTTRTLKRKLWKNFLSVFRNWKFHSRESRELSRENLYVPLATGPSTREQVVNLSHEKHENPIFWKILSLFRDWSIYRPMSHQRVAKNLCDGLATGVCDWFYPRLSRQNKAKQFLNFLTIFAKTKYFPKTTKTLKNLFVIDQQR